MSGEFKITRLEEGEPTVVLKLAGRMDAAAANILRQKCEQLRMGGHEVLILEMASVDFIASSGIGSLLLLTEEFGKEGGQVVIACPSQAVEAVVDLLNLRPILKISNTVEDALAVLGV